MIRGKQRNEVKRSHKPDLFFIFSFLFGQQTHAHVDILWFSTVVQFKHSYSTHVAMATVSGNTTFLHICVTDFPEYSSHKGFLKGSNALILHQHQLNASTLHVFMLIITASAGSGDPDSSLSCTAIGLCCWELPMIHWVFFFIHLFSVSLCLHTTLH